MIRRVAGGAATTLIVVAALGLACWFVFSAVGGASLITFRTGSMSPTMPQGAVAVTVPVRAPDIAVGDVVTVQRAGESTPVTHRVVEIGDIRPRAENEADLRASAPGSGPPDLSSADARQLVMQGDDNDTPDSLPYALTDARKVIFALPHAGAWLMALQTPAAMGALILLVGAFTVWAFWPRPEERAEAAPAAAGAEEPGAAAETGAPGAASAAPAPRRARHAEEALR